MSLSLSDAKRKKERKASGSLIRRFVCTLTASLFVSSRHIVICDIVALFAPFVCSRVVEMNSYEKMNRVLITDDVDSQCVDILLANGFLVEKDIKLAKQSQEEFIRRAQVLLQRVSSHSHSLHLLV